MTGPEARHVVVGSLILSASLVGVADLAAGNRPTGRQIVGYVAAGFVLSLLADAAPALGAGLAGLLAVSTVLTVGDRAFTTIGKAVA